MPDPFDRTEFDTAARRLCDVGREMWDRGWAPATAGNYSIRLQADCFAVTPSGQHKGRLQPDDIIACDLQGAPLTAGKPSAETLLHAQLYRRFDDVGAALHTHSVPNTMLGRLLPDADQVALTGYELLKAFGINTHDTSRIVPIFDNTQDIAALAVEVEARMDATDAALLKSDRAVPLAPGYIIRGHGSYTWGRTIDDACSRLEALDFMLACELEAIRIETRRNPS